MVGIVGDSVVIAVDVAEIGVEVAEIVGVLEGVSSITGPIGAAVGAIVFIGTDIYLAARTVEQEDKIIHLTGWEKFKEGWRAFLNIPPEQYIEELMREKQGNNQIVRNSVKFLKNHTDILKYIFPTQQPRIKCSTVTYQEKVCNNAGRLSSSCGFETFENEECKFTGYEVDLNSIVFLNEKKQNIKWSRTRPDNPENGELFCLPKGDNEPAPIGGTYFCDNAIGLSYRANRTGNYTLIALGDGEDKAVGFKDSPNIFLVNNGSKEFIGGDKDDEFVLSGNKITGVLDGGSGDNTIDFGKFRAEQEPLLIDRLSPIDNLRLINMNNILGREGKKDIIGCDCNIKYIDGRGGKNKSAQDVIDVNYCTGYRNEVQIAVRPYTIVYNYRSVFGKFTYVIHQGKGEASIRLRETYISGSLSHSFLFDYALEDIKAVSSSNAESVEFTFLSSSNLNSVSMSSLLRIENIFCALNDGTKIKIGDKGNLYALQNTDKPVDKIIEDYPAIANRLSMTIAAQSRNESIIIGHGKHEVLYNDPEYDSHLIGNGGENIYVIVPTKKEINIHDVDEESSIDTLDLRDAVKEVQNVSLKVSQHRNDLLIKLENGESLLKFPIRIRDGTRWYKKLHVIMDSIPMQLEPHGNNWILSPLPLIFNKDTKIAVVTVGDIKGKNRLIIHKQAGQYVFSRLRDDLMIISDHNLGEDNTFIILLSNFYQEPKMGTLSIEFKDITISLQEKRKEVNEAVVFCPRALQVNKEFSAGGDDLLSHYNCLKFDSDEVLFLKLNSSLLLSSEKKGKLLVSNYYPDVHEKWDLPVELNDTIIEPEEFREKAENANSLRCYQSGEEGLEIYHNQPDNKHQIGLIDLKNKSILDCSEEIIDGDFILSSKGEAIAKVKNWNIYQHARKVMFAFGDAAIYNEKCIISNCNPEDIIEEFKREIAKLINKKDEDGNTLLHRATMKGDLDKAKLLVEKGADIHEKNNFNMTSLDVAYKYKQKEVAKFLFRPRGNEGSKQRHRRHHIRHGNRHMGHRNYHSPIQEVASSGTRPSSWINDLFCWVKDSVGGLFSFRAALPRKPETSTVQSLPSISQYNETAKGISPSGFLSVENVALIGCIAEALDNTLSKRYQALKSQGVNFIPSTQTAVNFARREFDSFVEDKIRNLDSKEKARVRTEIKNAYPEIIESFRRGVEFSGNVGLDDVLEKCKKCFCTNILPNNVSQSESQIPEKTDDKPRTCLNDPIVDKQLQRSL